MEWEGDWNGLKSWVRTLFPSEIQLPGADDEDADIGYPATIELLAGSRMNLVGTGHSVECDNLEEEDLGARVRGLVTDYLGTLPDDRIQAFIKLRATHVVNGENEVWTERDFTPRVWTRRVTAAAQMPPAGSVAGNFAAMRNATAPVPSAPQPPTAPVGGNWGAAARGQSPALSAIPSNGGLADASASIHGAVGSGEPINMLAHMMMFVTQTILSEHRFLIDHNAGLAQQLIGVLDNMARSRDTDNKTARKTIEDMYTTRMTAEVHRASSERDAEVARLTTELGHIRSSLRASEDRLRSEQTAAQTAAQAAAQAAALAAANAAAAERARASAPPPTSDQGMRGRLEEKVANAAEKVVEAVIAGVGAQQQQQQQPAQQMMTGPAPAASSQGPINQVAASMAGALGFPGLDISQVTPEVAAMLIKMLPVETRKAALKTTMMMDPHFGAQFSNEVAEAIDAVAPEEVVDAVATAVTPTVEGA